MTSTTMFSMKRSALTAGFSLVLALFLSVPAKAFWFGNPGRAVEKGRSSLAFLYDIGSRDVEPKSGGSSAADLDTRRFYLQYTAGLNEGFELFARATPGTARLNFENSSFNPTLWHGGAGLHWAPPEPIGKVNLGILGALDMTYGRTDSVTGTGDDKVSWFEGTVAGGVSVPVHDMVHVYGGLSYIKPSIEFEAAGTEVTFEEDQSLGGFLGVDVVPAEVWTLSSEFHFGNENTIGFALKYLF